MPLPTRVLLLLREAAEVCLERECGSVVLALAAALDVIGSSETDLSVTNAGSGLETLVVGRRVIAADRAMAGRGVRVAGVRVVVEDCEGCAACESVLGG